MPDQYEYVDFLLWNNPVSTAVLRRDARDENKVGVTVLGLCGRYICYSNVPTGELKYLCCMPPLGMRTAHVGDLPECPDCMVSICNHGGKWLHAHNTTYEKC